MSNKQKVQQQFGQAADDYATSDVHAQGESLACLLSLVRPQADWKMLDVATGAGHTALAFAPFVSQVVATDLTEEMLAMTSQLAAVQNLTNLTTERADAEQLPFPDSTFDLVTCRLAFHHFPQPDKAMAEIARVLKPGGQIGLTDNHTVEDREAASYYNQYEKLRDPSHHVVYSLNELQSKLSKAGFRVKASTKLTKEFEFHAWADRQRVNDADKQRLIDMMDAIPEALRPLFQPRKSNGTMYFSLWEAVILGELG